MVRLRPVGRLYSLFMARWKAVRFIYGLLEGCTAYCTAYFTDCKPLGRKRQKAVVELDGLT